MTAVLSVQDLHVAIGGPTETPLLRGVGLEVDAVRMLGQGLQPPRAAVVVVDGVDRDLKQPRMDRVIPHPVAG